MLLLMGMIWILPLFEGHPKLAPIYNPVDHMVPPAFPLLLIVPAIAIDLIVQWSRRKRVTSEVTESPRPWWRSQFVRDWGLAVVIGVAFMATFIAVQWNFSKFLISRSADNWFFAGGQFFPYTSGSHGMAWRNQFWDLDENPFTLRTALVATLLAVFFSRVGLGFGNWMAKVRR